VLCTHVIRRRLLHDLQGKPGPKVDAGARNCMLRVIGDVLIWSIVSKRTVIKLAVCLTAGRAGSRQVATST